MEPPSDCARCSRLAQFRAENRAKFPEWHNAPVPSFGPLDAPVLVVGLAPGLRGANRTGRPFTGDYAGDLLYPTLTAAGLMRGEYGAAPDDGVVPVACRITNAARCVPPENKPTGAELANCRPFLADEMAAMGELRAVLALGAVAHTAVLAARGVRRADHKFAHGAEHALPGGLALLDSYHCSRYNTNTGRLTPAMFEEAVAKAVRAAGV